MLSEEIDIRLPQDQELEITDSCEKEKATIKYPPKKKHVQKASHNPKKNLLQLSEALKNNLLRRKIKKQS
jgi:hypothetical protein